MVQVWYTGGVRTCAGPGGREACFSSGQCLHKVEALLRWFSVRA